MSQQQQDSWNNSNHNHNPWFGGAEGFRAMADAIALAESNSRAARIYRAHTLLEQEMSTPWSPYRDVQIQLARKRFAEVRAITSTVTLTPPPSP